MEGHVQVEDLCPEADHQATATHENGIVGAHERFGPSNVSVGWRGKVEATNCRTEADEKVKCLLGANAECTENAAMLLAGNLTVDAQHLQRERERVEVEKGEIVGKRGDKIETRQTD